MPTPPNEREASGERRVAGARHRRVGAAAGEVYTLSVVLKDGLQMGWGGCLATEFPSSDNFGKLSADLAINSMFVPSDSTCGAEVASVLSYYDEYWDENMELVFATALSMLNDLQPVDGNATTSISETLRGVERGCRV